MTLLQFLIIVSMCVLFYLSMIAGAVVIHMFIYWRSGTDYKFDLLLKYYMIDLLKLLPYFLIGVSVGIILNGQIIFGIVIIPFCVGIYKYYKWLKSNEQPEFLMITNNKNSNE